MFGLGKEKRDFDNERVTFTSKAGVSTFENPDGKTYDYPKNREGYELIGNIYKNLMNDIDYQKGKFDEKRKDQKITDQELGYYADILRKNLESITDLMKKISDAKNEIRNSNYDEALELNKDYDELMEKAEKTKSELEKIKI